MSLGKQKLRAACPKVKLEFKLISNPFFLLQKTNVIRRLLMVMFIFVEYV